jgi:hypothetical protein
VIIAEIFEKIDQEPAKAIAEYFSSIPNENAAIKNDDIEVPNLTEKQVVLFHSSEVWLQFTKIKTNKATVCGDLTANIHEHKARGHLGRYKVSMDWYKCLNLVNVL